MASAVVIQHLIALFLIVIAPIWEHFATERLKASKESRLKIAYYRTMVIVGWLTSVIALVAVGWRAILTFSRDSANVSWLPQHSGSRTFVAGVLAGLLLVIALSALQARRSAAIQEKMEKALLQFSFILPLTGAERTWWIFVCLTAGITEEILYRGFLIHYFFSAPFHAALAVAVLVSCVIFGAGHLSQGIAGVIFSAILALILSAIFLMTGNLLLPMILHALIDLRILLILRPQPQLATEA
ncbi:MAG: CPBP family intramembrane glutamic endopeptidase [Candidatus Acidiferrales bacterium]